jgi:hypothetical protein
MVGFFRFFRSHGFPKPFGTVSLFLPAGLASLIALDASGQDSQFFFDANGNFLVQTAEPIAPPQILGQPQSQIAAPGDALSFSVVVANTRDLIYQWRFNGSDINGAIGPTVLIRNVAAADVGQYSVVLLNGSGSVTSTPATLWYDANANGLPDSWELTYFGSLTNHTATGDSDGDGISNLQEFWDGTNPTNSGSANYRLIVVNDGGSVTIEPNQPSYANGQTVTLTASPADAFHAWLGDIVTRSNPATLVMNTNKTIFARFTPIDFAWTNLASGDWNSPTNWAPNLVPAFNDNATVTNTLTVTANSNADCRDLHFGLVAASPTLAGPGTFTLHGTSFWTNGQITGVGRILVAPEGTLYFVNPSSASITARTFENAGQVFWSGSGGLILINGATITNRAGAVFEVQNSLAFGNGGGALSRFDNAGALRKTVSPGTTAFNSGNAFNNYGVVDIQTGTLLCNDLLLNNGLVTVSAGATNRSTAGGSATGSFLASSNALVEWASGTFTLNPGAQLNGPGLHRVASGTLACATDLTLQNLDLFGTLTGTNNLTINGMMNWSGIMSGSGRILISSSALLNITNAGSVYLTGRFLENAGTILWTNASPIVMGSAAIITNQAGGLLDVRNGGSLLYGGGAASRLDNAGTFRKSVAAATTSVTLGVALNNYGSLDLQAGALLCNDVLLNNGLITLSAGARNILAGGGSASGSFNAAPGSVVDCSGSVYTLNPGAQLNGAGIYRVSGGTLTCNTDVSILNLDLFNRLNGPGTVTISGLMNWSGTMSGIGRTLISAGALLNITNFGSVALTARVLENAGTILWTTTFPIVIGSAAVITNRLGGLVDVRNSGSLLYGGGAVSRLDNAGTFRKSIAGGTTSLAAGVVLNNFGIVDLRSGILAANGGLSLASDAFLNCYIGGPAPGTNYSQLQAAGSVALTGSLSVVLNNGYLPSSNASFTVLTANSRTGGFANFYYPSNLLVMQMSNTPNSVLVRVTGILVGPPLLLPPQLTNSNILLTWTARSNINYRVESNPDLAPPNWTAIPGDVLSSGSTASKLDPLTESNRFYRVRVLP